MGPLNDSLKLLTEALGLAQRFHPSHARQTLLGVELYNRQWALAFGAHDISACAVVFRFKVHVAPRAALVSATDRWDIR
jgi:hypothetical protein